MKRGLTMIELLLALSLLSVLMLAVATWSQVTTRAGASAAEPVRWRAAAEAVLELIHDDLVTGDFGPPASRRPVELIDGVLQIPTRPAPSSGLVGPVVHRYGFNASSGELQLEQRAASGRRRTRLLLDRLEDFQCAIEDRRAILTVTITFGEELEVGRSYLLP
ncbi:MAG: prepilin-type N-terminal cleavage/methylation domain-containing protein [Planctomycetota bacterium]|jgi:prepilin-type N-terminal cleavage/methylation domain-containing protein